MKKALLLTLSFALFTIAGFSQSDKFWSGNSGIPTGIIKDKAVSRLSFPKEFKLFTLNIDPLRQELFTVVGEHPSRHSTIISLPNADGKIEQFEVFEASNFEPDLQAQFPQIRAFSGKGVTDKYATLKLSISPQGIQTMVFRTDKENEFIEPYSQDHTVYAVFKSHRTPGQLPWTCNTDDRQTAADLSRQITNTNNATASSAGQLKTLRLAQSCNGEYANYFGATSASQVALVLAAFNATITRCNGCYEKDLAVHLNLIAATTSVIYYNPSTDPYTTLANWNQQEQTVMTNIIGEANYDIGHMFGATGGGGNAGCIGCVCVSPTGSVPLGKGSGITSPADGIPQGDNFDIDYVVHEVGHQLGANHTFTFQSETSGGQSTGAQKEIGSGITIMGYAGITSQDVAPHSIDIYHEESIAQIQANLATKTCPVTTNISANNATPVVAPVANHTIPISTPFALTGSATDANTGDALTYCWEQNDDGSTQTGANSIAKVTKTVGPNWISFSPTASPTRLFPELSTILAGGVTTGPLPGGDAGTNIEALSSVARTLNFRLTVRDNSPYSSTAPIKVGQTAFTDMQVIVSATSGPFAVTSPNTAVSWVGGSTQNITWSVASTTAAPVSCANVKISLSTDGGQTFPTVLAASTPNDGTEALVIPNTPTTTARIKVEAVGNIFFDISNTNFTITSGSSLTTITGSAISPLTYCAGVAVSVPFTTNGAANAGNVFTAQISNAAGSFASPVTVGTLTSTAAGTIAGTIPAGTVAGTGYRIRVVSSSPVVTGSDNGSNITVTTAPTAATITAGGATTFCSGGSVVLSGNANGGTWSVGGGTTATLTVTTSGDYFVTSTNNCGSVTSNHITVTVNPLPTASTITAGGATTFCAGGSVVLSGNTTGGTWSVGGTTGATLTATTSGDYFVTTTNNCGSITSNHITVTVNPLPTASSITAGGATTFCAGGSVVLSGNTTGGTWSVGGTTGATLTATTSGDYFVTTTNNCGSITSNHITVTVNPLPTASSITAGGATTFCAGGSVVLSGNTTGGTWSVGGTTGATLTATTSGDYFVTTTNNCGSVTSNHITVTVNPLPTASSITAGGATTFCAGGSVVLSGNTTGGTWSVGGGTTATLTATTSGDYFVTNTNNCGSVTSNHITVTVNQPPTASTITAGGATTFCAGGSVVLSGNTTGGTWSVGGTTGATLTATTSGDYFVTTTNSCGSVTSNHITVTVNPLPTASSITAGGATTFCAGGSVVISGNTTGGTWSVGGGTTATLTATTSGDYFVTNTNNCGSVTSNHITVTVNPLPVASTITAGGPIAFCAGGSVVLSGNTNGVWNVGTNNTSGNITVTSGGDYFVTTTNNCGSITSNHITVTVNPLPTVSFSGLASSYAVNAASATLTGSPAGGTFSGPGISGSTFSPAAAGSGGPYTITYTYTNANGCTNSSSQQTTVTGTCTLPARPGTITTVGGTAKVCPGDVKTYTIVAVSGATSYTWTAPIGGVVTNGQNTVSATITYNSGFTAGDSLRVTANNTCGSSIARALKINRNLAASEPSVITGAATGVCNSSSVPYSVTNVAGVTYAWSWSVTDATIANGQGTNAITADFLSTYVSGKLMVTAANACGTSAARSLTVYARPGTPVITGATTVCSGQQGVAYSLAPLNNASSYTWYVPTGSHISDGTTTSTTTTLTTTATNVTVNFGNVAGPVRAKGNNTCASSSVGSLTVVFGTCKENMPAVADAVISKPGVVQVYPNPSNGAFRIVLNSIQHVSIVNVAIINEFGQTVYHADESSNGGIIDMKLSDKLTNGIYFVNCTVNGVKTVNKLMISK